MNEWFDVFVLKLCLDFHISGPTRIINSVLSTTQPIMSSRSISFTESHDGYDHILAVIDKKSGETLAHAYYFDNSPTYIYLHSLWVKPEYRECGMGTFLMDEVISRLGSIKNISLEVRPFGKVKVSKFRATAWFESYGFELVRGGMIRKMTTD